MVQYFILAISISAVLALGLACLLFAITKDIDSDDFFQFKDNA